ncbi:hypothetical protein ABPG72_008040 [Tetrahymena utriculariae]
MVIEFLTWVIEVAVVYVIPLVASLRVLNGASTDSLIQERWLIHWVSVVVANFTLYPLLNFLDLGLANSIVRLAFAFGLLFIHKILGNKISDLNDQFLTTTSSLLETVRGVIKAQLVKYDLVKAQ